jgi:hypothetical protein
LISIEAHHSDDTPNFGSVEYKDSIRKEYERWARTVIPQSGCGFLGLDDVLISTREKGGWAGGGIS